MPEITGYTPYSELADRMMVKMKSFDFQKITDEEVYDILYLYIDTAVAKFDVCVQNLDDRDENGFNVLLTNVEKDILSSLMLIEYMYSEYIVVPDKMRTYFSSRDLNAGSAWQQLGQIESVRDTYKRKIEQMISRYSYRNSKLFKSAT